VATRVFGLVLILLGAARLAWPPASGTSPIHTIAATAEILIGMLCLARAASRVALGFAVVLLSVFATYNLVRIFQGEGASSCGCHARVWDATHAQTLIFVGLLLAWASLLVTRQSRRSGDGTTPLVRLAPVGAVLAAVAALLFPPQRRELPPASGDGRIDATALVHSSRPPVLLGRGVPQPARPASPPAAPVATAVAVTARSERGDLLSGVDAWWEGADATEGTWGKTDERGAVAISRPAGAGRIVGKTSDGIWAAVDVAADADRAELRFDDSTSMRGTTVDLDGTAVPQVTLLIRGRGNDTLDEARPSFADRNERMTVRSGPDGRFEIRGFTKGLVTIVPTEPRRRVVADNNGVLVVRLPAEDVKVRIMNVRDVSLHLVDADTNERVAPPYVVQFLSREAEGLQGLVETASDGVRLHLPEDRLRPGSTLSVRASGFDHPPQERSVALTEADEVIVPLRRELSGRRVGSIEIGVPDRFLRPGSWDLVYLARPGASTGVRRTILEADGKWVVMDMAVGTYDVLYMGKRIASSVTISERQTTNVAGDFGAFAPLRIRPLVGGRPARGVFHVAVHPEGDDMWGNSTFNADASGVLTVGFFPVGSVDVTQVFRSNLRLQAPVKFQLTADESQRDLVGDVTLVPQ
jgi:hypothetical protein